MGIFSSFFGGFLGDIAEEAVEQAVSRAVIRGIAEEAGGEARDKAANEGQTVLLDNCVDAWIDYAVDAMSNGDSVDGEECKSMSSHPEAIGEIADDFASQCNDEYEGALGDLEGD